VLARVDRQWRYRAVWKVAVCYYVDALKYFESFRPTTADRLWLDRKAGKRFGKRLR
jgi:hypothetical protein